MQKLLVAAALAFASLVFVHYVFGANAADLPKGVAASSWIPISDRLGFVMEPAVLSRGDRQILFVSGPIHGHFVAKTSMGWQRIAVDNPDSLIH
jgi:hypothetical protein